MKKIKEIISKKLFINSFNICKGYCKEKCILDVNFRLLKNMFLNLTEEQVGQYYDEFIETEIVFALPELFTTDVVAIPKNITNIREYRFFSVLSMILYNAVGLLFVDCCSTTISSMDLSKKRIFSYYPSKFKLNSQNSDYLKWEVENDYKINYNQFLNQLEKGIEENDIVLQLDISNYFESINHIKLIKLLEKFSPETSLMKNNYQKDSYQILEFYFESLMRKKDGIPQGKKNFVSDYFGYIYLLLFDMNVEEITRSDLLEFKSQIRYVDDFYIIFRTKKITDEKNIFKELLKIEAKVINWLYKELSLNINSNKTIRKIIDSDKTKNSFIKDARKTTSNPMIEKITIDSKKESKQTSIDESYQEFIKALKKFKFKNEKEFQFCIQKKDSEKLKKIFDKKLQNYLFKKENKEEIISAIEEIDFELIIDYINILIVLFFLRHEDSKPFQSKFLEIINNDQDLNDKRFIHILFIALAQYKIDTSKIKRHVKKNKDKLIKDNYGKYLLALLRIKGENEEYNILSEDAIFRRITTEHNEGKLPNHEFIFVSSEDDNYIFLVNKILKEYKDKDSVVRQLKYYVHCILNKNWDSAFNHFHSIFHEVCKIKYDLDDQATINVIIDKLGGISAKEELLIRKFYIRRNFNLISHPSQKGIPSVKVSERDLKDYYNGVMLILKKIL